MKDFASTKYVIFYCITQYNYVTSNIRQACTHILQAVPSRIASCCRSTKSSNISIKMKYLRECEYYIHEDCSFIFCLLSITTCKNKQWCKSSFPICQESTSSLNDIMPLGRRRCDKILSFFFPETELFQMAQCGPNYPQIKQHTCISETNTLSRGDIAF